MKTRQITVLLMWLFLCSSSMAKTLVFNTSQNGYPPFLINHEDDTHSGIMFQVIEKISQKLGYQLETLNLPKMRVSILMGTGNLDATATAKEWVVDSDKYVFSDVIIQVKDLLAWPKARPIAFEKIEDLFGKTIGTHHGYRYPLLDEHFITKSIRALSASSEFSMLKNTMQNRVDATVINATVAKWIIKNDSSMAGKFTFSEKDLGSFGYRIMFSSEWKAFVELFNKELALMKETGELEKIILAYE